jgi:hypothetical protein
VNIQAVALLRIANNFNAENTPEALLDCSPHEIRFAAKCSHQIADSIERAAFIEPGNVAATLKREAAKQRTTAQALDKMADQLSNE